MVWRPGLRAKVACHNSFIDTCIVRGDSVESFNRDPEEFAGKDLPLTHACSANSGGERGTARTPVLQFPLGVGVCRVKNIPVVVLLRQTPLRRG